MAESELEARLLKMVGTLQGQVNALQASLRRLQAQVSHPSARAYIDSKIGSATTPIDHGTLIGLGDDDHVQYFNTTRGDVRYRKIIDDHWQDIAGVLSPMVVTDLFSTDGVNTWQLGANVVAAAVLDATSYLVVTVNGVPYKLAKIT